MNLVLQSFGREGEYKRAILSILSFYAHTSLPVAKTKVILFTDKPAYFEEYLKGLPVHYILLTTEKIKAMRGEIDFLHRMKIALIEEAFSISEGILFYVDSDTFFIEDPKPILDKVSESTASMHLLEYAFEKEVEDKTETYRAFYNLINSKKFALADASFIKVTNKNCSWNAGVMVFYPDHKRYIPDVFALTDQFYPDSGSHASEQYAFSVVLQSNLHLEPCDKFVYHYWYRVKKQIIDLFLSDRLNPIWAKLPLDQKLLEVKAWANLLPAYMEQHILMTRDHAIQAFNENKFSRGYLYALKAIAQSPLNSGDFMKDTLYHINRHLKKKKHAG